MGPDLVKLTEIENLSNKEVLSMYKKYINPRMLKSTALSKIIPVRAEGMYIFTRDGRKILDFTCGRGVLGLGHNHPRIIEVRKKFEDDKVPIVWKEFPSPYLAVLSKNLAEISPGELNYSFICNSGAEAVEGALKIAEKFQGKDKDKIIAADNSFHGKTHAALSVSGLEKSKKYFKLLNGVFFVPYGDYEALERLVLSHCKKGSKENDVCAIILEPICTVNIIIPPEGYLKKIRQLTQEYGILLILDEVYSGFGKTGKMFAFEHEDIIPDVFTVSKTFGGGKATVAAYIARDHVFKKAYGSTKDALIHSSTYNGFSQECITAIEAINILHEENLVKNAWIMGDYLLSELSKLKEKYPRIIKAVRGKGLLCGIEFELSNTKLADMLRKIRPSLEKKAEDFITAAMVKELFFKYNILTFVRSPYNNFLHVQPSLIVKKEEIEYVIEALDSILSKGVLKLAINLAKNRTLFWCIQNV